jgi:ribosomal protein S18 acetylase RimI-like enzyme
MSSPRVRDATPDEAVRVADRIAGAFTDLAAARWLVPDRAERRDVLRRNFRIIVEHAFEHGQVNVLGDGSAVAVWLFADRHLPPPPDYDQRRADACGPYTDRFATLDKLFDEHHPGDPHHHLAFLAVDPALQRTGRGTALLRHHHARLDADGIPGYLEASNTESRDLYARHGYRAREPFTLPDGTPFWPMWRPAPR